MMRTGQRAVVVGASMSGLLSARVLTEAFDRVTVVDRDELPGEVAARRGVPQGRHPHGLLARGLEVLEELFPGLTHELVEQGAAVGDMQRDVRWYNDGHLLSQSPIGMQGIAMSRPLLEDRVRARVLALPGVELVAPAQLTDLVATDGRVSGVRVRRGGSAVGSTDEETLAADLVVDATGRGSHTPSWLESHGFDRPQESRIDVDIRYTTWVVPRYTDDLNGDLGCLMGATVARPRFGAALALEGGRWIITAGGYRGDVSPADLAGFRTFAAGLPAPEIGQLMADREPVDGPRTYHFVSSTRRHYEQLTRFPRGLVVTGDAVSSFNPVYGQGITMAAAEALVLRDLLTAGSDDLARQFFRRAARLIDVAWDIAAGSDLRLPSVPGPRPARVRLVNAYVARVQAAAAVDPEVGAAFLRVANLIDPPESLLRPRLGVKVFTARRRAARVEQSATDQPDPTVQVPRPRNLPRGEVAAEATERPRGGQA
jgi:2-polyprenyl-6-methoxyphenol hydroxylase-like FAD-dependent oxidoreductase